MESVDFVPGRTDAMLIRFVSRLDSREKYCMLQLLRERFAEKPGSHRIEVGDDWAIVPVPDHDDSVGAIVAHVLGQFDEFDARGAALRADLQGFARQVEAQIAPQVG